jgi:hypothetical protein
VWGILGTTRGAAPSGSSTTVSIPCALPLLTSTDDKLALPGEAAELVGVECEGKSVITRGVSIILMI